MVQILNYLGNVHPAQWRLCYCLGFSCVEGSPSSSWYSPTLASPLPSVFVHESLVYGWWVLHPCIIIRYESNTRVRYPLSLNFHFIPKTLVYTLFLCLNHCLFRITLRFLATIDSVHLVNFIKILVYAMALKQFYPLQNFLLNLQFKHSTIKFVFN